MEKQFPRFFEPPKGSYFLFGPRGVGKSSWIARHYSDALRIDLLDPSVCRRYLARPEMLMEVVAASKASTVIIDEVQKVPELLSVVHKMTEEDKKRCFVLTGSSSRKLKRSGVDLLAGRALRCALHPFMAGELGSAFSLKKALATGLVPLVYGAPDAERTLSAYAGLYIREEVQAEGLVRNMSDFSRFLEAASFSHAAMLTVSDIARECGVERKTVEGYLRVLEDLMLSFRVPVFSKRAMRHVVSHDKWYFFDAGMFVAFRPQGVLDSSSERDGAALEGLIAQHLRAWIDYAASGDTLYYWRTKSGVEVDFVVYGKKTFVALEIKNSQHVHDADLKGLCSFGEDYPQAQRMLVYRGKETMVRSGVHCVPVEQFLSQLHPHKSLLT
jgi:predicted AAA+ superfamily ATPase